MDVYAEVTDRIVAALEEGTVPWRKPWSAPADAHCNPVSGTVYRGVNPFLLELTAMERGYSDPRWLTFKQAKQRGAHVMRGERATLVVFWKQLRGIDKETGEERRIPLLRQYRVFNVAQIEGLDLPEPEPREPFCPITCCAEIIAAMPDAPTIGHGGGRAFYAPAFDAIQLPEPELFTTPAAYYATAFHELAHSTGHGSRLNRPEVTEPNRFGSEPYGREELTAELAASMLCGVAGISPETEEQSAAYLASWLRSLKADPRLVVTAAGRAQRAADYVRGIRREETQPAPTPEPVLVAA